MNECKHEGIKHTERLMTPRALDPKEMKFVICTWCVDCGKGLSMVDVKDS